LKDIYFWILAAFVAVSACVVCFNYGYVTGAKSAPMKYAICENGTCVISDKAPDYPGK